MPLDKDALDSLRINKAAAAEGARRRAAPWIAVGTGIAVLVAGTGGWWLMRPTALVIKTTTVRQAAASGPSAAAVLSASGYVVARRISTPSAKITAQVVHVFIE